MSGSELQIVFLTDESVERTGFYIKIGANLRADCTTAPENPPAVQFAAAFTAVETMISDSIPKLPKRGNLTKLGMIKKRFGWFAEFSDAPCATFAGEGIGSGVDFVPPVVDAGDVCATIASFYNALLGYYDDFVCMDRAAENPFGERRMRKTSQYLRGSKKLFNRFLKKLSCDQKL